MNKLTRFPKEVGERAIRSIVGKIRMSQETLWKWVRQAERDGGLRPPGTPSTNVLA